MNRRDFLRGTGSMAGGYAGFAQSANYREPDYAALLAQHDVVYRTPGISWGEPFYLDRRLSICNDVLMRRTLYERFGLGEADPEPRLVIESRHIAGGFVVPALLGVRIRFLEDQAAWPMPANLSREQILALRVPQIEITWPMDRIIADMDALQSEFGYITGDLNTGGIFNTALELRGQQLFVDLLEDPELVDHLFSVVAQTQALVARYVQSRTGTSSVATNRSILHVDPKMYLNAACSVQMISPRLYQQELLAHECCLAGQLRPYGIHLCGNNLQLFAQAYSQTGAVFYDVGWGSDVARCCELLPDAFLNLRLSPVRMLRESAEEIRRDTLGLLEAAGRAGNVGVCCINMDYGTPDEERAGNVSRSLGICRPGPRAIVKRVRKITRSSQKFRVEPNTTAFRNYLRESGRLDRAAPKAGAPSAYEHDPKNPLPTIGGRYGL